MEEAIFHPGFDAWHTSAARLVYQRPNGVVIDCDSRHF
jgi:hypothetical protein